MYLLQTRTVIKDKITSRLLYLQQSGGGCLYLGVMKTLHLLKNELLLRVMNFNF